MNELLGRPKSRWYGIIKTCLKETGCKGVDWEDLRVDGMALLKHVLKKRGVKV
jgi:hypothetical protein